MSSDDNALEPGHLDWQLVMEDRLDEALVLLSANVAKYPQQIAPLNNRLTCYFALGNVTAALDDARQLVKVAPETDVGFLSSGVAHWWLGEYDKAVHAWRGSLNAIRTEDGRGLEAPRLLLFAAASLQDRELEREARTLLRKRWRPQLVRAWPGAITGYLLGKIDEQTFLIDQTFLNPILEARRLCRARFWVAVQALRTGTSADYAAKLRLAAQPEEDTHLRATLMLEEEYWLARIELARVSPDAG